MLVASLHIARGMGARPETRSKEEQEQDRQLGRTGENEVGNARLGLWVGERLEGELLCCLSSSLAEGRGC
jgi:hypothetical protein